MIPDTPDDANISTTHSGQLSPGCLTAHAILCGHGEWPRPWGPPPTISHRTDFGTIVPPTRTRDPFTFLRPGSFILFQLDTRELAAQVQVPEGSETFDRCVHFPTKRYVGLVLGSFCGEGDSDVQGYDIAFVSKSPPLSDSFAVPIHPTEWEDINGRRPLRPRLFPWAGCYQYTVLGARITPTRTYPSAIEYRLNEGDFEAFDDYTALDRRELQILSEADMETSVFEEMRTSALLPVRVWQELAAERECHDPRELVMEVLDLKELVLAGDVDEELPCE